jgi:hypothetical protein
MVIGPGNQRVRNKTGMQLLVRIQQSVLGGIAVFSLMIITACCFAIPGDLNRNTRYSWKLHLGSEGLDYQP